MKTDSPQAVAAITLTMAVLAAACAHRSLEPQPPGPRAVHVPAASPEAAVESAPNPAPGGAPTLAAEFPAAFFDLDSYHLRDDARAALDEGARRLRDMPGLRIVVEGHCDERGTAEYNQALGERRARAARDYLVAAGIESSRIETVSFGKERPLALGHLESSWAQNRRAHLVAR